MLASPRKKAMHASGILLEADSIRRLAPLRPRAILCSGHNYADHRAEKPPVPVENPEFFLKLPQLVRNPGEPILLDPRVTSKLDHETGETGPGPTRPVGPHRELLEHALDDGLGRS